MKLPSPAAYSPMRMDPAEGTHSRSCLLHFQLGRSQHSVSYPGAPSPAGVAASANGASGVGLWNRLGSAVVPRRVHTCAPPAWVMWMKPKPWAFIPIFIVHPNPILCIPENTGAT